MTLITDALNRVARQCSVRPPSSWVTATRDDHVELRDDYLLQTVEDIQDRVDLPAPVGASVKLSELTSTTTTDPVFGTIRAFTLPENFKRLHREEIAIYDAEQDRPAVPVPQDGAFSFLKDTGTAGIVHYYQLSGYDGNFTLTMYRDPGASPNMVMHYNTVNWMASSAGVVGSVFATEEDVLALPRRVVEAGTVYRFRERRGLPYADKFSEYETYIQRLANDIRQRRKVSFGQPDKNVRWQDLVPSFIPSS